MNDDIQLIIPILLPVLCGLFICLFGKRLPANRLRGVVISAILAAEAVVTILIFSRGKFPSGKNLRKLFNFFRNEIFPVARK